jgi:hypothetical protein
MKILPIDPTVRIGHRFLPENGTSTLFTEAERAARDYLAELTTHKKASPDVFAHLSLYFPEREICEIM